MDILIEIINSLIKLSPLVAVLSGIIYYLYKKVDRLEILIASKDDEMKEMVKAKDNDIKELNLYIRKNDKDNQMILSQVATTLDKVLDEQKHNVDDIKNHISMLIMLKNKDN